MPGHSNTVTLLRSTVLPDKLVPGHRAGRGSEFDFTWIRLTQGVEISCSLWEQQVSLAW